MTHQGAWLAWATGASLAAVLTTNPFYLGLIAGAAVAIEVTARPVPTKRRAFRIFAVAGLGALLIRTALVLFQPVTSGSVVAAVLEGSRLAVMLIVFGTFNAVSDPFRVVRLTPRRFHEPALAAALALSIAPRTVDAVGRVREAQRMRGIEVKPWRALPALAVPILETGMEEAMTLAESMDARGHGRGPRSRYKPDKWSARALVVTLASVAALMLFVAAAISGSGHLTVSTEPLTWPPVSDALVCAALLFSTPAVATLIGGTH
ncbi:MAG: energy-coupling factor transporter transmembrane protein EcfT [Actinomycetota bacterium]|nr:energy-coupling factor transporter transmembrane protein EcfT [Actinomycetota bacterium]